MTNSPTTEMLGKVLDQTDITRREIAQKAGFPNPNAISMMKKGDMKVPIDRIPALARACGVDPLPLLSCAMHEYMPAEWAVIRDIRGEAVTQDELALLRAYREATFGKRLTITPWIEEGLVGFFGAMREVYERARAELGDIPSQARKE